MPKHAHYYEPFCTYIEVEIRSTQRNPTLLKRSGNRLAHVTIKEIGIEKHTGCSQFESVYVIGNHFVCGRFLMLKTIAFAPLN